jgi:hypothetical protein
MGLSVSSALREAAGGRNCRLGRVPGPLLVCRLPVPEGSGAD